MGPFPVHGNLIHCKRRLFLLRSRLNRLSKGRNFGLRFSFLRGINQAARKTDTHDNPADIFTKPLVGAALRRLRAFVLGLQE